MSSAQKVGVAVFVILIAGVLTFTLNRGYGKVSAGTYESAKAIYGACLAKSPERLAKVEQLIN